MTEQGLRTPEETAGVLATGSAAKRARLAAGPRAVYQVLRAIDALGTPVMLRADAVITSSDPLTGEPVTITVTNGTARWDPPTAVVYSRCCSISRRSRARNGRARR